MVRALPDQKAHTKKKKGAEPPDRKAENKAVIVDAGSTSSKKKLLKELPVGALPKTEPPMSDAEWEEHNVKMLHDFEEKLRQQHPPESTPCAPMFPKPRSQLVAEFPGEPPTMGGSDVGTQYGTNLRGMWGGMFLFSIFITFIISWSPGITLLWVGTLTLFLSTLNEFRAQARDTFKEGLTRIVTFAGHKLGLKYLSGNAGGERVTLPRQNA
jgi:hypothetical protein